MSARNHATRKTGLFLNHKNAHKVVKKILPIDTNFEWWEDSILDGKISGECEGSVKGMRGRVYDQAIYSPSSPHYAEFFIEEIFVKPQQKGCGRLFMNALEKELKQHKVTTIYADVTTDAIESFKKLGFTSVTKPPSWTETNWGNALYMMKKVE